MEIDVGKICRFGREAKSHHDLMAVCFVMRYNILTDLTEYEQAMSSIYCGLVAWERSHNDIFGSSCGRELYFKIAEGHFSGIAAVNSLKHAYYTGQSSERSMRNTIRRFEELGFLERNSSPADLRVSRLIPKEALLKIFQSHACELYRLMNKHFVIVYKNEWTNRGFLTLP